MVVAKSKRNRKKNDPKMRERVVNGNWMTGVTVMIVVLTYGNVKPKKKTSAGGAGARTPEKTGY